MENTRQRELHEQKLAELELEIQRETTRQAEAECRADQVRQDQARIIQQVGTSQESLSVQLDSGRARMVTQLWPYLLMTALALFVFDVALRRIDFSLWFPKSSVHRLVRQ